MIAAEQTRLLADDAARSTYLASVYAAEQTLQGELLPATLAYYADLRAADADSNTATTKALVEAYERIDAAEGSLGSAFTLAVVRADATFSNGYVAALHAYESRVGYAGWPGRLAAGPPATWQSGELRR